MRADWVPRLQNEEADALTNSDYRHFDPALRVPVVLEELKFVLLTPLLESGEAYRAEVEAARAEEKARLATPAGKARFSRKRAADSVRERDPW